MTDSKKMSKARQSVLADGTSVDQDYFQSKHYILSQLEQRKSTKVTETDPKKSSGKADVDNATKAMLKSGAVSEDDGWLLASMELPLRNPFCIANCPALDQVKFYQKVFLITSIFMFMVAFATLMWTWWWGLMIKGGTQPILPCRGNGDTFGKVQFCNETSSGNAMNDDGCNEDAPLSVCVSDSCVNDIETDIRNCWYVAAFVTVIMSAYMLLLFRRDQAGKGLLSCACFIEGIIGGAASLHYDSSLFIEFFTYLCCATIVAGIVFTQISKKNMEVWEKLPNQVGSLRITVPEVEVVIHALVKKSYVIGAAIVTVVALIWHFGKIGQLTGGSDLALFIALFTLWLSVGWLIREISWTQHKYDADQFVNMCISFHVDLYCIFILLLIFCFFVISESCNAGPLECCPTCLHACGVQGHRCANFICGIPGKGAGTGASADGTVPAGDPTRSSKKKSQSGTNSTRLEKEVETDEDWRRRKMINAGCAFGILALAGISFFAPQLSFAVSLAVCVGLPFFRAKYGKEEDEEEDVQCV